MTDVRDSGNSNRSIGKMKEIHLSVKKKKKNNTEVTVVREISKRSFDAGQSQK